MSSTTAILLNIVNDLRSSKACAEEAKGAEKARIGHLLDEAKRLFESGYERYTAFVRNKNSSTAISQDHAEVHVLAAEAAFATDHVEISRNILDNFFKTSPQKDSIYCRAKLARALVMDAEAGFVYGDASITQRRRALKEVMETLDVAMDPANGSRYNFVVYNASVIMWRVVHQFIRSTRGRHFTAELQRMSSALESINDPDKEWRIMYISATAAALEDADQKKLASDTLDKALDLAESCLEAAVAVEKTFLDQMAVCKKETDELMAARRAQDIYEEIIHRPPKLDPDAPDGYAPKPPAPAPLEGLAALSPQELKTRLDASQARLADAKEKLKVESDKVSVHNDVLVRLYLQRVNVFPGDTKRVSGSARVAQSLRTRILTQLQSIRSGAIPEKDWATTMQQIYTQLDSTLKALDPSKPPEAAPVAAAPPAKGGKAGAAPAVAIDPASQVESLSVGGSATSIVEETLLDLSRFAWALGLRDLAVQSNERADMSKSMAASIRVKSDFCKAIKIVADLATVSVNEETGQRLTAQQVEGYRISKRIEALKLLERILGICASRLKDVNLLHEICVAVWNTALPLLQSHLRHNVHGPFLAAAQALEDFASPMTQLRAQLHYELCKCEEQNDFVVKAKLQAEKALHIDYGAATGANSSTQSSFDKTRNLDVALRPVAEALELRSSVYDAPEDVESLVLLSVHQVSESRSRNFQEESLYRSIVAMLSATKTGAKVDENAVLGNGVPQMAISKVKSFISAPSLDTLTAALSRFGEVAAQSVAPPANEKPTKGAAPAVAPAPSIQYATFDALTQKRCLVMYDILKAAAQLGVSCFPIVQHAAAYLLQFQWDPEDPIVRKSVLNQVDACFLLSESLVARLSLGELTPDLNEKYTIALDALSAPTQPETTQKENSDSAGSSPDNADAPSKPVQEKLIEPMCLGVVSKYATDEMQALKQLVVRSLLEAMKVAGRIKDDVLCQNAFIYFWNQHVHIFRRDLSKFGLPILVDFLKIAHSILVAPVLATAPATTTAATGAPSLLTGIKAVFQPKSQDIDFRLRVSICEAYASLLNDLGTDTALAQEVAIKGCSTAVCESPYVRQRLCELACKLMLTPPPASASAPAAGGKGGAKGPATATKASEPPKFDHPFLNAIALLAFAEDPSLSKEQIVAFAARIRGVIDGDLKTYVDGVNLVKLNKEEFEQLLELRAEVLTRLTRVYVMAGDVYGAYKAAEQCTKLIEEIIKPESSGAADGVEDSGASDSVYARMPPRVWRWVSLCERYFGAAVSMLIKPTGQDKSLQNDLYLASLRHYALSCQFGRFASVDKLVVESATDAWNICMPLIDVSSPETTRSSLHQLIRIILQALEGCAASMYDEGTPEHALGDASDSLKQRYFLAIIEGLVADCDWEGAMKVIMDAFEKVPQKYQRSIWKLRVVVMSKRGKNALDGIQKLKEGDPSLQAKVYGVLARAAALPQQQLEAYVKAIDSLSSDVSRVEYILEMAQWLASSGMPKVDIYELLLGAVDALAPFLVDASHGEDDEDEGDADKDNASSVPGSAKSKSVKSLAKSTKSLAGVAALKTAGRKYIASSVKSASVRETDPTALPIDPNKTTLVHCDYAFRVLSMIALIEPQSTLRTQKALEAVFFIERSLHLWNEAMKMTFKRSKFMSIPLNERQTMDFRQYTVAEYPSFLSVPTNSLDLMLWSPSEEFEKVWHAARAHNETSLDVPSPDTHVSLVLSIHYLKSTSDLLLNSGFPTSALLCIAWTRAILIMQTPLYSGVTVSSSELEKSLDPIHVELYYRALFILKTCGLEKCGARLSKSLGRTSRDIASFFASIATSAIKSSQSTAVVKITAEKPRNETMNPYGFHTHTDALGKFDANAVVLSVCSYLCKFGSENAARSLLNNILPTFQASNDQKSLLKATLLLASLEVASGRWTNALALLSSVVGPMSAVGEPENLADQTCIAMVAYTKLDMLFEAKQLASAALAAMDASIVIPINKPSQSASPSLEMTSRISQGTSRAAPTTASTQALSVISNGNTSNYPRTGSVSTSGPPSQAMELSLEGACVYARICSALVSALCDEAMGLIKKGTYPLDLLTEVSRVCDECLLRIAGVEMDVSRSSLYATILSAKAQSLFKLSLSAYAYVPSKQQNVLEYKAGILDTLRSCAQMQSEACEIRRQVACLVPVEEESFVGSTVLVSPIFASKPLDAAAAATPAAAPAPAAKGKEAKGAPVVATPAAEPKTVTEGVSNAVLRQYGLELIAYSNMLAVCSAVDGSDAAKRVKRSGAGGIVVNREMSVIEKFLQDSAPVSEPTDKDFRPSDRVGAVFSASSSIEFLRSSMFELTGKITHLSNALCQIAADSAVFDFAWHDPEHAGTDSPANVPRPTEVSSVLQDLSTALVSALRDRNFSAVGAAPLSLVDCYGKQDAARAANWLILSQSVSARQWLWDAWTDALPGNSDVRSAAVKIAASAESRPFAVPQTIDSVNHSFLMETSAAYRRLQISTSVGSIVGSLAAGTHVLCVNYSAADGVIFCCAGLASAAKVAPEDFDSALPGSWVVEKMTLLPEQQRDLQSFRLQHKAWCDDIVKFIATYNDQMTAFTDIANQGSSSNSSGSFIKAEKAISDRHVNIFAGVSSIFEPLLGKSSRIAKFLHSNLETVPNASLLLLLDPSIQELPLEALDICTAYDGRVFRDFSIHMLGHRLAKPMGTVGASLVSCVVDPYADDVKPSDASGLLHPMSTLFECFTKPGTGLSAPGADRWRPVCVKGGCGVTLQDWAEASAPLTAPSDANKGRMLYVHCPAKLSCNLTPGELSLLNLSGVSVAFILDGGHSDTSYRRQNGIDNKKTPSELVMEDPIKMLALISLNGANSVAGGLWSTSFASQYLISTSFWRAFATEKQPLLVAHSKSTLACAAVVASPPNAAAAPGAPGPAATPLANSSAGAPAGAAVAAPEAVVSGPLRPWLRLSRVFFGVPTTSYDPAA